MDRRSDSSEHETPENRDEMLKERRRSSRSRSRHTLLTQLPAPPKVLLGIVLTCIVMVLIIIYVIRIVG